ncbi:MAG: dual specificity protein phosphatase family protein [Polyangiaceae bacterium]|nr:dual specificity protein phosphatase family protein [Polyangiaceae bacterium]
MTSRAWLALWLFWLGAGLLALGMLTRPWGLAPLGWMGLSTQAVAAAYAANEPRVFGKRRDGRVPLTTWLLFAPYLALAELTVWAMSRLGREPDWDEIVPGLFLGRRASRLPDGVTAVVDLTAELGRIPGDAEYLPIPTLDGAAPRQASVLELVRYLDAHRVVAIHCAAGHGRSAMVMAALLVARGHAADAAHAEALMRDRRPGVRMSGDQRATLARIARVLARRS